MPFTVSLKEHLEMLELRNVLLWFVLLRVECFVAAKKCFRNTHDDNRSIKHSGVFSCLYLHMYFKTLFCCFLLL